MADLPDPMTPADCDLRDFPFMPLDVVRLRDSGLTAKATGDEFRAAVLLWCASWHQVPSASLPDDDDELANICGYSRARREWSKVRAGAMRGWVNCNDGRLYHAAVASKALEAWIEKLASAIGGAVGNAKRWNVAIDTERLRAQFGQAVDALRAIDPQSRTLRKKAVAVLTLPSVGDSPPDSPIDSPPDSPPDRNRQGQGQGDISPSLRSGDAAAKAARRAPRSKNLEITLAEYLTACKAEQRKPLPADHPIRDYCRDAGIPEDMLQVAWIVFKDRHTSGDAAKKRQKDWPGTFANSVKSRWYQLWYVNERGEAEWTSTGQQERKVIEARLRPQSEVTHEPA